MTPMQKTKYGLLGRGGERILKENANFYLANIHIAKENHDYLL
jgi:hypothetical protein